MAVWIASVLLCLLLALTVFCARKDREALPADASFLERWLLPAGKRLYVRLRKRPAREKKAGPDRPGSPEDPGRPEQPERHGKLLPGTSDSEEIHDILVSISGPGEGEKLFERYEARKWGYLLGALMLCLCLYVLLTLTAPENGAGSLTVLERPEAGSRAATEHATLTLTGKEGSVEKDFSFSVPARDYTPEEAEALLSSALSQVESAYEGSVIASDLSLPQKAGAVRLSFSSLTPSLMRSDGTLQASPGQERQTILLQVRASLAGTRKEAVLKLYLASAQELSLSERADLLIESIQGGRYTGQESLALPSQTEQGDAASFTREKSDAKYLWVILFLLIPGIVLVSQNSKYKQLWKTRLQKIDAAFPEFLEELSIVMGAGMSLTLAFQRLASDYRKERARSGELDPLYEEVGKTGRELSQGVSMREALDHLSARVPLKEVRQFTSLLCQSMKRGDRYMLEKLREMSRHAQKTRSQNVRRKMEEADTRLLFPLVLMLIAVLMMVLTPALLTMGL